MLLMGLIRIRPDCECHIRTIVRVLEEDKGSFAAAAGISAIIFKGSSQSFSAPVNITTIQRLPHCVEFIEILCIEQSACHLTSSDGRSCYYLTDSKCILSIDRGLLQQTL